MKKSEVSVGKCYIAKVANKLTTVRVDRIMETTFGGEACTTFVVTNLRTGRETKFRSAAKFRSKVSLNEDEVAAASCSEEMARQEGEQSLPPTKTTSPSLSFVAAEESLTVKDGAPYVMTSQEISPKLSPLGQLLQASIHKTNKDKAPHLIIEARAGCGKSTTIIEGARFILGQTSSLTPSPQQQAIWDSMSLSKGAHSIGFVAFNRSIAAELKNRVPQGCEAMTMHSMGLRAITAAYGRLQVNQYRLADLISHELKVDIRELRKSKFELLKATKQLVDLCKVNLLEATDENLWYLADYFDIDFGKYQNDILSLVPLVLESCKDVKADDCIDYTDMIWIPTANSLTCKRYDVLLCDEQQDMNRAQQSLAKKVILVGDSRQSIYQWAGADAKALSRMSEELAKTPRGCITLPLTVTRRCGKRIVEEAKKIVPDFEAHESNPPGAIEYMNYHPKDHKDFVATRPYYLEEVKDGEMVLCRINAPLVTQAFRFIRNGRRANIQGRDIGQGLISTVNKLKAVDMPDFVAKLSDWLRIETQKEQAKRNPSETKIGGLHDRYECLMCFTGNCSSVADIVAKIENLFTDGLTTGIKLSSIHRAKGLENSRVFLLQPKGSMGRRKDAMQDWECTAADNLTYVAINTLVYVS